MQCHHQGVGMSVDVRSTGKHNDGTALMLLYQGHDTDPLPIKINITSTYAEKLHIKYMKHTINNV